MFYFQVISKVKYDRCKSMLALTRLCYFNISEYKKSSPIVEAQVDYKPKVSKSRKGNRRYECEFNSMLVPLNSQCAMGCLFLSFQDSSGFLFLVPD